MSMVQLMMVCTQFYAMCRHAGRQQQQQQQQERAEPLRALASSASKSASFLRASASISCCATSSRMLMRVTPAGGACRLRAPAAAPSSVEPARLEETSERSELERDAPPRSSLPLMLCDRDKKK